MNRLKKLFCLLLTAAALFSLALPALAGDDDDYYYVNPMPKLQITRDTMSSVQPGEEFTLTVTLTNPESISVLSPTVHFTPSDAFLILDSTPTRYLSDLRRKTSANVSIRLKALEQISAPNQSVKVDVDFRYDAGSSGYGTGTAAETVFIPVETNAVAKPDAPLLLFTRGEMEPVTGGQAFDLRVTVQNLGDYTVTEPLLTVSPDSSLLMLDPTRSRMIDEIAPGAAVDAVIRLQAKDEISSPVLSTDLSLNYAYLAGEKVSAKASETVYFPAVVTEMKQETTQTVSGATPNVILSQYSYGEDAQVAAGSTFALSLEFKNTSALFTVENIVMTISTGEGLSISSSSNTMYYPRLLPGGTQKEALDITVLPTAKTGSAKLEVSFSYEYVDQNTRCKVNTSQDIAIPVYQPDRFEVELPALPEFVDAYNEMYVSLPYVNKGKSEVSNIRAELISADGAVSAINPVQNLGNFASGSSGTIDFIFTPVMPGDVNFTIAITYEDPNAREKTVEFPVHLTVSEPYYPEFDVPIYDPGFEDPMEEASKGLLPWWGWTGIGAVIVLAVVLILVRRKKHKKAAAAAAESYDWDDAPEEVAAGGKK